MKTNDDQSYIEKCIQALPPEKQSAARKAFEELGDGDLGALSRVLIVLEATTALAKEVPRDLAEVSRRLLDELDARRKQAEQTAAEREKQREERLRALLIQQVPALGRALAVDRVAVQVEQQKAATLRLERSVSRLRHLRVGGVLALMLFSVILVGAGGAAIFWKDIQSWRHYTQFLGRLDRAGVSLRLIRQDQGGTVFEIKGPVYQGTGWIKDANGNMGGVDLVIQEGN